MTDAVKPGDVLAGRFRIEEPLGAGGFGSIWRAHHQVLDAPVALKLMDPEIAKDPDARERFMREARAAANLRSQNVVQILDYGVEGDMAFIVMELLEGEDLGKRLKRVRRLEAEQLVPIFTQVCRAVGRAHAAGIIHRDLKPANVFLVRSDDGQDDEEVAKVLDFGVAKIEGAKLADSGAPTRTGSLIGTPHYMSPEQLQGNKAIDSRSDLWSLGVIVFEALTGERPYASDGLGDLVLQICVRPPPVPSEWARVPRGLDAWMARALAHDPQSRFQSAKEMAAELAQALSGEGAELVGEDVADKPRADTSTSTLGLSPTIADTGRRASRTDAQPATATQRKKRKKKKKRSAADAESRTVAQFGTSRETPPPPGAGRALRVVAGIALVAGLAGGYVWMRQRKEASAPPEPAAPTASVAAEPEAGAQTDDAAAAVQSDGAVAAAPDAASQPSAPVASTPNDVRKPKSASSAKPKPDDDWRPKVIDGKVVKPTWAEPDPEPPAEEPSPDNPY